MKKITKGEKETQKVAIDLVKTLQGGEIILLYGDLGAGKTVFVKGLAKALGVKGVVKSPTFNLMKCYKLSNKKNNILDLKFRVSHLCHIDAYRLESADDLLDIGADDYINQNSISVIEWAERVDGIERLGEKIIKVKIGYRKKENERKIEIN